MILPRFYPILDTVALGQSSLKAVDAAESLLSAGARILQLRHKAHFDRVTYAVAVQIACLCRDAGALFVVNDRVDVAMLLDAAVHVGQDDLHPSGVRRIAGGSRIVGFSTHNEAQLLDAADQPVDYVALGPIFGTRSKTNPDPEVGLLELRRLARLIEIPLVAIGGITLDRAVEVWSAGAGSIAVVGDLYPNIRSRAEEWVKLANE